MICGSYFSISIVFSFINLGIDFRHLNLRGWYGICLRRFKSSNILVVQWLHVFLNVVLFEHCLAWPAYVCKGPHIDVAEGIEKYLYTTILEMSREYAWNETKQEHKVHYQRESEKDLIGLIQFSDVDYVPCKRSQEPEVIDAKNEEGCKKIWP